MQGTDGSFYGTTALGGAGNKGTVFRTTPAGALTTLHSFAGSDGATPRAGLVQGTDGSFYGTTHAGGANGTGTVFRMTPAGTLTTLASFDAVTFVVALSSGTGALVQARRRELLRDVERGRGKRPGHRLPDHAVGRPDDSPLVHGHGRRELPSRRSCQADDGSFYGTTNAGGAGEPSLPVLARAGTVFRMAADGTLTTLHSFTGSGGQIGGATLARGSDGNFWGTTATGGSGCGTVFRMTPGGALTTLVDLTWSDGCFPWGGLVQARDQSFYGTTPRGGPFTNGVVFRLTRDPELFLPVLLDDVPGVAGSRYTTELTLASKATTPIPVTLTYTASVGEGSGSVSVTLAAGETRILPNAIAFLRAQGLSIPAGSRGRHAPRHVRRRRPVRRPVPRRAHVHDGGRRHVRRLLSGRPDDDHHRDARGPPAERRPALQPRARQPGRFSRHAPRAALRTDGRGPRCAAGRDPSSLRVDGRSTRRSKARPPPDGPWSRARRPSRPTPSSTTPSPPTARSFRRSSRPRAAAAIASCRSSWTFTVSAAATTRRSSRSPT